MRLTDPVALLISFIVLLAGVPASGQGTCDLRKDEASQLQAAARSAKDLAFVAALHELEWQYDDLLRRSDKALKKRGADPGGLTDQERMAVYAYSSRSYKEVNSALRRGDAGALRPFIQVLTEALSKLPDYRGSVYRGTTLPEEFLGQHQVGAVLSYGAFTSCSQKTGVHYFSELPHQFIIESTHGKAIEKFANLSEGEILFKPNTRFQVTRVEKQGQQTVFWMKELD